MGSRQSLVEGNYPSYINQILLPSKRPKYTVLDLFAGCGGLSLGFESAGFKSIGMEMDESCCNTYNDNLQGECSQEFITSRTVFPKADVIIGGPPCQPFSVGGKQLGNDDKRISRNLRSQGWSVLRLWEHDIEKKPEKCKRKILKKITSKNRTKISLGILQ